MSRRYGQVPLNLWRNPAFRQLPDDARIALLFFWCGPHSTSAGVGRVPDAYAASDLNWPAERWQKARAEVEAANLIRRDPETEDVLVCGYLEANRPANPRHRAAILGQINSIECEVLKEAAFEAFSEIDGKGAAAPRPTASSTSDMTPQLAAMLGGRR